MKNPLIAGLLLLTGQAAAQESRPITVWPALYAVTYLRPQTDPNTSPKLIGSVPVSVGRFYGEVRYNYDADKTTGIYGGRTFSIGTRTTHSLTAQLGLLLGDFSGLSTQIYYQLSTPRVEVNSQQQYSVSWQKDTPPFYYTWSDVQWKAGKRLRLGASVQAYRTPNDGYTDGGLLIGCRMPRLCVGLYYFNFYRPGQSYGVLALQYEIRMTRTTNQ